MFINGEPREKHNRNQEIKRRFVSRAMAARRQETAGNVHLTAREAARWISWRFQCRLLWVRSITTVGFARLGCRRRKVICFQDHLFPTPSVTKATCLNVVGAMSPSFLMGKDLL
jgi:hypothetical protein